MTNEINKMENKLREAIKKIHESYKKNPWIFMTESDIQCYLYSELLKTFQNTEKTYVYSKTEKTEPVELKDEKYQILTLPIHAELSSSSEKKREFVDLCMISPINLEFNIKGDKVDFREYTWKYEDAVGIEIKGNWTLKKKEQLHKDTNQLRKGLTKDIEKLQKYEHGWLIFVDNHSLFEKEEEWIDFVNQVIRDLNQKSPKKTLNP